ncbi:MAG: AAA family ATPase [Bacteroidia bacterium]|nr:AAA family ATPase [Bacteroidia bacterium]
MKRKLPLGISDYKKIIEGNYYYLDKTLIIKEILDAGEEIILITRPRRFGKTLNISTLRYFFEKTDESMQYLFQYQAIWSAGKEYTEKQGQYPVIFLTFKDVKKLNWGSAYKKISSLISDIFKQHKYLLNSNDIDIEDKSYIKNILQKNAIQEEYEDSLLKLTELLRRYHKRNVILLIDEYDTPIHSAYFYGYYNEMINFMRNFLGGGLKDNVHLEKAVLTGILRVAKESIFSGLNNIITATVLNYEFSDKFGLSETEVEKIIIEYNLEDKLAGVQQWYNGYIFGDKVMYNPWSILNYVNRHREGLQPHWVNTSSNDIVKDLIIKGSTKLKQELHQLMSGESLRKVIETHTVFRDLDTSEDAVWSFLLFSGYLKAFNKEQKGKNITFEILIPNIEVQFLFESIIIHWLSESAGSQRVQQLLQALLKKEIEIFHEILQDFMLNVFSYYNFGGEDTEKVYQAFLLGLFVNLHDEYEVNSEKEAGYGRCDIIINHMTDKGKPGFIIELKRLSHLKNETLDEAVNAALEQIEEKQYEKALIAKGIKDILKLGIAFDGKRVEVKQG